MSMLDPDDKKATLLYSPFLPEKKLYGFGPFKLETE